MKTTTVSVKDFLKVLAPVYILFFVLSLQGCKKEESKVAAIDQLAANAKKGGNGNPNNPPPPPPPAFYFSNCNTPTYSATFTVGTATNTAITKNYVNSPGGSYSAFTSATVNGITITAPAGTFNVGSGSVIFTATGTPINTGFYSVVISVGNIQPCMMYFTVTNAPVSGPTADPGTTPGSTGVINFTYKGQPVAYKTVRAKDGKIWLQQNLGSPQVAFHQHDEASFGDYFQWGRWDDGHQTPNSPVITGGSSLMNPSHIPSGNPNFIVGATAGTTWWGTGGSATDTWSGSSATSTNGIDPCTALGAGWHLPTAADWQSLKNVEDLDGALAAFMSNLKLPINGHRDGGYIYGNVESYYWSATPSGNYGTEIFISDNTYFAALQAAYRSQGNGCRCVKN
jgi:hypothetical protein